MNTRMYICMSEWSWEWSGLGAVFRFREWLRAWALGPCSPQFKYQLTAHWAEDFFVMSLTFSFLICENGDNKYDVKGSS